MNKWEFASQVGSITQNINADGSNTLIVAQPGGTLLKLKCGASAQTPISERREKTPDELIGDLDFEPLVVRQMRNFNVSCEIQGGFKVMKREDRDDDTLVGSDGKDPKGEEEAQEMADKEKCEDEQVDGGPNETLVHSEGDKGASSDAVENKLPRRQQFNDPQDSGEKGSPGKLKYIDTPADPNNVDSRDMVDPLELSENVNDPERRDMSREREATAKKEIWSIQRDFKPAVKTGPPRGVKSSPYAVATLDGTVLLVQDEEVLFHLVVSEKKNLFIGETCRTHWNAIFFQTHQQLFCVRKLDIRGIGQDDIVLSSWNGYTFVVTQGQGVMQFVFEDVISTFTCGSYTVDEHTNANGEVIPKETVPVFVYVTFKHEIYIYHKLKVETGECNILTVSYRAHFFHVNAYFQNR